MHHHPFLSPPATATTAITVVLFFTLLPYFTTSHPCSSFRTSCPPFTSTLPFPFSSIPGCGHPSFQINCSNLSRATISINHLTFSLLNYQPNSTSLILSPHPTSTSIPSHNCSSSHSLSIPAQSINLSASPFRISDSSCSRLSVLKPCPPPNLPNCSHCSWQCKLIKTPFHLVHGCAATTTHQISPQGCQSDVLEFLERFLKLGFEIEWDEENDTYFSNCKSCQSNHGVCGFNSTDQNKPFICFGSITEPLIRQKSPNRVAVLCITFLFIFFLLAVLITTLIARSRRSNKSLSLLEDPAVLYLHRHRSASLLPPVFKFEELQLSTNNFDPRRKIGDGGFGVVFLGQLYDNSIVAVKYLHRQIPATKSDTKSVSAKSFCNEILILSSTKHPNLVKLHGYCSDPRGLILVYEYVANGTLADHLHGTKSLYFHQKGSLTWEVRIDIALQIAVAIEYLHFLVVPPIVHRDITSNNIFVERDMRVKVGDFGLSRLLVCSEAATVPRGDADSVWTGPQGTPGYLDPDYYRSFRLTEKSDIYSFGVVLLELVTGMRAMDQRREKREMALADMVVARIHMGLLKEVVDPVLAADKEAMEGVGAVAELAFRCVAADKDDRPNAREVVAELRSIRGRTRGFRMSNSGGNIVVVPESGSL